MSTIGKIFVTTSFIVKNVVYLFRAQKGSCFLNN